MELIGMRCDPKVYIGVQTVDGVWHGYTHDEIKTYMLTHTRAQAEALALAKITALGIDSARVTLALDADGGPRTLFIAGN